MKTYSLKHLSNRTVRSGLTGLAAQDRDTTAKLLAYIAEFDARKLFVADGYPSVFACCVGALHMSEDIAYKRIRAARLALRFPVIFEAVAEGRLHLSGVVLLAPFLIEATSAELIAAATHKTRAGIEQMLAERFPRPDLPALVQAIEPACQLAPGPVGMTTPERADELAARPVLMGTGTPAVERVGAPAVRPVGTPMEMPTSGHSPAIETAGVTQTPQLAVAQHHDGDRQRVTPLAPQRFGVQFTMDQEARDLLCYAQELLGHQIAPGDVAAVFKRALQALVPQLERQKFAATERPRPGRSPSADPRHIPAPVKREVWERDQGQCTFVSEAGHRCEARTGLEFDHVQEVARGGTATVSGIRLRCRAHNQFTAECTFGAEFMRHKRLAAAEALAATRLAGRLPAQAIVVSPAVSLDDSWARGLRMRSAGRPRRCGLGALLDVSLDTSAVRPESAPCGRPPSRLLGLRFMNRPGHARATPQNSSRWVQRSLQSTATSPSRRFISFAEAGEWPAQWLLK